MKVVDKMQLHAIIGKTVKDQQQQQQQENKVLLTIYNQKLLQQNVYGLEVYKLQQ